MKRSEDHKKIISNELKELKKDEDEIKALLKEKDAIREKIKLYGKDSNNKDKTEYKVKSLKAKVKYKCN